MSSSGDTIVPPKPQEISTVPDQTDEGADTCRICRGEALPEQPLFHPCKCSGSIRYVHQDCLMEWLAHSQKKYCELCKTPFRFTKLYDQSMPDVVPWPLFLRQVVIHTGKALGTWTRYTMVLSIWLCWLPWTIRQVWRALFWLADGSWLTSQEVEATVKEFANQTSNISTEASIAALNSTALDATGIPSVGFFSTLITVLGILDPQIFIRAVMRLLMQVFIAPAINGEPVQWERAFLFTSTPRPPSLLSDVDYIASATKLPVVNHALIDILEGQLICLTIVAVFILVFLIREWVINQQPLINAQEGQQPALPVPEQQQDAQRQAGNRRRRALRQGDLPRNPGAPRPIAPLRPRRRATDNNIAVNDEVGPIERPQLPPRAASLIPALDELEANAGQLEELMQGPAVESPPLERGQFDDLGLIQRTVEETRFVNAPTNPSAIPQEPSLLEQPSDAIQTNIPTQEPQPIHGGGEFTFRSVQELSGPTSAANNIVDAVDAEDDVDDWESTNSVIIDTPSESPLLEYLSSSDATVSSEDGNSGSVPEYPNETPNEDTQDLVKKETIIERIANWLWYTEDFNPDAPGQSSNDSDTEVIAQVNAPLAFQPLPHEAHAEERRPAAAHAPIVPAPNIQNGINLNDPNAVDDAEDLEGVLELIGMEGPLSAMIQNIIFSVFLITLTLSASIWCPYIWGKIALLFIAHPYGVFFRAPLYLLSRSADFVVDVGLFTLGTSGMILNFIMTGLKSLVILVLPDYADYIRTDLLQSYSIRLSQNSGSRLEKMVTRTLLGFRPDLPTFSIQSHHVLRVFINTADDLFTNATHLLDEHSIAWYHPQWYQIFTAPVKFGKFIKSLPSITHSYWLGISQWHGKLQQELRPLSFANPEQIDYSLVQWSTKEKITCIILGYILFTTAGAIYLRVLRWMRGLKPDEKLPGFFAETLTQAGGVMKVIVIIGIEMIAFPLFCGTMLDIALLPLFAGASLYSRCVFLRSAPFTALFVHWFVGTCYMFHFALFVSMCRKLMRKGVLYFIRDPDDPSFHPVRDVLERPVATQLGKIAFSAFVYGSLLLIFLGGIVSGLNHMDGLLPVRWGSFEPTLVIPGDIIFYNFFLPLVLSRIDLSKKLAATFNWWFRACAGGLRLSDFFFGLDVAQEKQAGMFLGIRFLTLLVHPETPPKHPMVEYVEKLASERDRLVWFENKTGPVNAAVVEKVFPSTTSKIITLANDGSQALVIFDATVPVNTIKAAIEAEANNTDAETIVKKVKDMKIENVELPDTRKGSVDPSAGSYVRAPAKDSARIPKGQKVFLTVDENNQRTDGQPEIDTGLHGRKDDKFGRIFVPNHFRARVSCFVGLIWLFVAIAGLVCTIGPLVIGRLVLRMMTSESGYSDVYAYTIGTHIFAFTAYTLKIVSTSNLLKTADRGRIVQTLHSAIPAITAFIQRVAKLFYMTISLGLVAPILLSLLAELYINIPVYIFLVGSAADSNDKIARPFISTAQGTDIKPSIHLLQTWAIGLVYLRMVLRYLTRTSSTNTRPAAAIHAITRNGLMDPDIKIATRALFLPITVGSAILIFMPLLMARAVLFTFSSQLSAVQTSMVYRCAYPILLLMSLSTYLLTRMQKRLGAWRTSIRDEVYLIGERLHNFPNKTDEKARNKKKHLASKVENKSSRVEVDSSISTEVQGVIPDS